MILGGGAACGLTEGSQWAIHPAGTKAVTPERSRGVVALTAVRAVTSEARLLGAPARSREEGMRAVEESHALETRLPVEVVAPSGHGRAGARRRARPLQAAAAGRARRACQGPGLSAGAALQGARKTLPVPTGSARARRPGPWWGGRPAADASQAGPSQRWRLLRRIWRRWPGPLAPGSRRTRRSALTGKVEVELLAARRLAGLEPEAGDGGLPVSTRGHIA